MHKIRKMRHLSFWRLERAAIKQQRLFLTTVLIVIFRIIWIVFLFTLLKNECILTLFTYLNSISLQHLSIWLPVHIMLTTNNRTLYFHIISYIFHLQVRIR